MTERRRMARRGLLGGLAAAAVAPAVLAQGRRQPLAEDAAVITVPGHGEFTGKLTPTRLPAKPAPGIVLVHDGFGVTPQMQVYADALAFEGYVALVVDLFRGKTAGTDLEAAELARTAIAEDAAIKAIAMWADWLRSRDFIDRRLGLVAFGPSCAWSLAAARQTLIHPMAFFYGRVQFSEEDAKRYPNHVIAHFGDRDDVAGPAWRYEMENRFRRIGSKLTQVHHYPAGRNFANPLAKAYAKLDAQVAWNATVAFFVSQLGRPEK
ncbi:MAG: dienelactone hydrolase family protein [Alphaproteobacteria bacterium]|nr:dienelactone hydrolase family protein [Alphaproteobacteria bacterium]MCW5742850.1 dienelactone hydrolase family protein [Alphaproteobacteria bacterium]